MPRRGRGWKQTCYLRRKVSSGRVDATAAEVGQREGGTTWQG